MSNPTRKPVNGDRSRSACEIESPTAFHVHYEVSAAAPGNHSLRSVDAEPLHCLILRETIPVVEPCFRRRVEHLISVTGYCFAKKCCTCPAASVDGFRAVS